MSRKHKGEDDWVPVHERFDELDEAIQWDLRTLSPREFEIKYNVEPPTSSERYVVSHNSDKMPDWDDSSFAAMHALAKAMGGNIDAGQEPTTL